MIKPPISPPTRWARSGRMRRRSSGGISSRVRSAVTELTAIELVVDALAMSVAQCPAPSRLRRRVLGTARAEARRRTPRATRSSRLTYSPRVVLAGALAVLVLALAAVGVATLGSTGSGASRTIAAQVVPPSAAAQVRLRDGRGQLIVRNMPAPPAGRIYEVWLRRGSSSPSPTRALFGVTADGAADVDVPGDLSHVDEILVTQEPAGGSRVSTRAPVIVARLT